MKRLESSTSANRETTREEGRGVWVEGGEDPQSTAFPRTLVVCLFVSLQRGCFKACCSAALAHSGGSGSDGGGSTTRARGGGPFPTTSV